MRSIKTLCLPEELEHYTTLGQNHKGNGAFVELGCWLGASTEAILKGLPPTTPLHVFDSFVWTDALDWYHGGNSPVGVNRSFLHVTLENLKHDPRIRPYVVELSEVFRWDRPIEVLVLDAAKTIEAFNGIVTSFFPHLMQDAYLFDQDFRYGPSLHMYQKVAYWFLKEHLQPVCKLGYGVGFKVIKPMDKWDIEKLKTSVYDNVQMNVVQQVIEHFKDFW